MSIAGRLLDPRDEAMRILINTINRTLSEEEASLLSTFITACDLAASTRKMPAHSVPELDGFTAAFYQIAPGVFAECLKIVFNFHLARGVLLPCQRQSAVSLLHKKGKLANSGNYRSIALVGVDVKALSKVLAFRLEAYLPKLIYPDQKSFVKGRSFHHHVHFLSDLRKLMTGQDDDGYAVFLYSESTGPTCLAVFDRIACGGEFLR